LGTPCLGTVIAIGGSTFKNNQTKEVMKKIFVLAALVIALTNTAAFSKEKKSDDKSVKVLASDHDIFYFRIKSKLVGGVVEVYNANKDLLGFEELTEHEMLIDFDTLPPGKYSIKIKKFEQEVKEYSFIK
jgi:hypothetical protein